VLRISFFSDKFFKMRISSHTFSIRRRTFSEKKYSERLKFNGRRSCPTNHDARGTENDGHENAGNENAGHKIAGQNCRTYNL